jgi:hypothetical protein
MGLFIEPKDVVTISVFYVYDKEGDVCVLSSDDVELIKNKDDKESVDKDADKVELGWDIPFNILRVDLKDFTEKDIRSAIIDVRKPSFQDVPSLIAPLKNTGASGYFNPSEIIDFNSKRLNALFKKGVAQGPDGSHIVINRENLSTISPAIGIGIALEMNRKI